MSEPTGKGQIGELNGAYARLFKIQMIIVPPLIVAILGVLGFAARQLIDVDSRVIAMEASRFTSSDGLLVWKEIAQLREKMAAFPNEWPPRWFQDRVASIEANQRDMAKQLQDNNNLLIQLTAKIEALERSSESYRRERMKNSEPSSTNSPG